MILHPLLSIQHASATLVDVFCRLTIEEVLFNSINIMVDTQHAVTLQKPGLQRPCLNQRAIAPPSEQCIIRALVVFPGVFASETPDSCASLLCTPHEWTEDCLKRLEAPHFKVPDYGAQLVHPNVPATRYGSGSAICASQAMMISSSYSVPRGTTFKRARRAVRGCVSQWDQVAHAFPSLLQLSLFCVPRCLDVFRICRHL